MRGHVSANGMQVEGPGGANRCRDCDGYRPDTLGGELAGIQVSYALSKGGGWQFISSD